MVLKIGENKRMIDIFVSVRNGIGIGFIIGIVAFLSGYAVSSGLSFFDVGAE